MTNNDKPWNGNGAIASASRQRSANHPRNTLKQAEELARVIYGEGSDRCDPDNIAKKAGFSAANNGSFKTLRATASQFGLIVADGSTISLSDEWKKLLWGDDPQQLRLARQQAMRQPDLYKLLIEEFGDRQLPSVEKLAQHLYLTPKYGILKDAAGVAAKVFFESASYAVLLDDRGRINPVGSVTFANIGTADGDQQDEKKDSIREQETDRGAGTGQAGKGKENTPPAPPAPPALPDQLAELFKFEITLESDEVVHIYGPRRILPEDKERIKKIIDTWLEPKASGGKPADERSNSASAGKPTDDRESTASDRRDAEPKDH